MLWTRYVQRKLRVFLRVFWPCPLKTTPNRALRAVVRWHQNKATQSVIKLLSEIFDNMTSVSEFYFVSVPDILYGRLRDFYTILNCVRAPKLNYFAMQNGRKIIECYSFRISSSLCYGRDTSNGSWGFFCVFFGHARLRPPQIEPCEQLYGDTKIKPHSLL